MKLFVNVFGSLVAEYITINEPNVYATNSYYFGQWPPGKKSLSQAVSVMSNMAICHIKAYQMIHSMRETMGYGDTKVSFANHLRVFDPQNPKNPWHCVCAKLLDWFFQGAITEAISTGNFKWPLKRTKAISHGEYLDFIAINYYTRSTVSGFGDGVKQEAQERTIKASGKFYTKIIEERCISEELYKEYVEPQKYHD